MPRILQPELLDSLPPDHPDAQHNRRDIRRINRLMGNFRWFAHTLPPLLRPGEIPLEMGAGTGELALNLARRGIDVDALDLWPTPKLWPADRRWHRADLRHFSGYGDYPVILGNLIFHQFSEEDLAALGTQLRASARVIIACEPLRRPLSQTFYQLFGPLMGANHVSLHDAHVSIAAGFCDEELPRALGLARPDWDVRCTSTALGAYRMVAVRRS